MSEEIARDLGAHDEAINTLKAEVAAMRGDLAEIKATLAKTQGAWRALLGVSAFSSAITAAAFKVWGMMEGGV